MQIQAVPPPHSGQELAKKVAHKARRKINASRRSSSNVWFGLGMMGLIGWSVVIPTVLGAALGIWLDNHFGTPPSWVLTFLLVGLMIGCFTAWSWLSKEHSAMQEDEDDDKQHK